MVADVLERNDGIAGVKAIDPLLRSRFAIRPRTVGALSGKREAHRPVAGFAVFIIARQMKGARQQLSRQQVDVVYLRRIERRVAEAERLAVRRAIEPVEQKAATAFADSQTRGAAAVFVPIEKG